MTFSQHEPITFEKYGEIFERETDRGDPTGEESSVIHNDHSIANTSKFTQQCNVVPYFYAVY